MTATSTLVHLFTRRIRFIDPEGGSLEAETRALTLSTEDDRLTECTLELVLAPRAWQQVDAGELFHLQREVRGPNAETLAQDAETTLEVRLGFQVMPVLAEMATSVQEAAALISDLGKEGADHPLMRTESWYALRVTQAIPVPAEVGSGSLAQGYQTSWATGDLRDPKGPEQQTLFGVIFETLETDGWHLLRKKDEDVLVSTYQGDAGAWTCYFIAREVERQAIVYSQLDGEVPAEWREEVMRYITRANFGMAIGNFEIDLDDGTFRFRTSIDLDEGQPLSPAQLRLAVEANLYTMDRHFNAIVNVTEGTPARDALNALTAR